MSQPPGMTPDPQQQPPQPSEGGAPPPPSYDAPPPADQSAASAPSGPPPGHEGPPPASPTSPGRSGSTFSGVDADHAKAAFQGAHKFDLGIIAAGVLTFIFSFLPYYSVELKGFREMGLTFEGASDSATAWHGFFGWFAALVALAVAVVLALHIAGVRSSLPTRMVALVGFGVAAVCVLFALFIIPGGDCQGVQLCEDNIDFGHGIGYWLTVVTVVGGLVLSILRRDAND